MRGSDTGERVEDGFEAAGTLLLPLAQHRLDLLSLQQLLGAAQVAGNDRERAQRRVGLEVRLLDVRERADHGVPAVVGDELRRHRLQLPGMAEIQDKRLHYI